MNVFAAQFHTNGQPASVRSLYDMIGACPLVADAVVDQWCHAGTGLAQAGEPVAVVRAGTAADGAILAAVGDVRLDNPDELVAALGGDVGLAARQSDLHLALAAYRCWGEQCVERLHGDFAVVIHDGVSGKLFAARDRAGVKPLYYAAGPGFFAASTSMFALETLRQVSQAVDDAWVGDYLAGIFVDAAATFRADIRRLPPAHAITITPGGKHIRRYARLGERPVVAPGSDAECIEAFAALFADAVKSRMRPTGQAGGAVAAALSGGLDSSSVAMLAQRALPGNQRLATYSAVFDSVPESNERAYAEQVVAAGHFEALMVPADGLAPLADGEFRALHAQPFYSPNLFVHWALFKAAAAAGRDIWLDGLDGDTTVSHGMAYPLELARSFHLGALRRELAGIARNAGHGSALRSFRRLVLQPMFAGVHAFADRARGRRPWGQMPIADVFARASGLGDRLVAYERESRRPRGERADHLRRLEWALHPFVLETLHACAAPLGIEPRYPFYDWRLMEFCLAMPPTMKLRDGWSRWILRLAMSGMLPRDVAWRSTKGNPGANFVAALRTFEGATLAAMAERPAGLAAYVDVPRLRLMVQQFGAGGAGNRHAMALWKCLTLWPWLRDS